MKKPCSMISNCKNCYTELNFVKYPTKNGRILIRKQCPKCGKLDPYNYKYSDVDLDSIQMYDESKKSDYRDFAINRSLNKKEIGSDYYGSIYLKSKEWKIKRDFILKRDNYKCRCCGNNASDVHHIHYRNVYEEKEKQLISLCRLCHEKVHFSNEKIIMDGYDLKTLNDCQNCGEYHNKEGLLCVKCSGSSIVLSDKKTGITCN